MSLAESHGGPVPARPFSSLLDAFHHALAHHPRGAFLHAKASGVPVEVSYEETLRGAGALAAALRARGLRPGDGLILNLHDSEAFIPALWGAILAGLVVVPLVQNGGRHLGRERRRETFAFVRGALTNAQVLTDDPHLPALLTGQVIGMESLQEEAAGLAAHGGEGRCEGVRLAVLTSGATGRSKLVGLDEDAVLARWWPQVPDGGEDAAFLSWSPFDHIMGLGLAAPNLARKIHLDAERFAARPLSWLDAMEATQATHATMTNFGMSLLVEAMEAHPERRWRLDRVRKIGIGAEQVSAGLCARFLDLLVPFGLREDALILGYGLTECGPVAGGGAPFSPHAAAINGAVRLDRPTPGHSVRIVDDAGGIVGEEEVGQVEVRGPTMTCGYLDAGGEDACLFTADGWLRTGDLGLLRDGVLTIVGRVKEQIVVNAKKYSCQEIEATISSRSGFRKVYAVPLEGTDGSQPAAGKPVAIVVVGEAEADLTQVAREVRAIVAATYRFAPAIVARVTAEDVPRTALGKVQRFALAARVCAPDHAGQVDRLGAVRPPQDERPAEDEVMGVISKIWSKLLKCDARLDPDANFFMLGGDSILALQMGLMLEERFGIHVPLERFTERASLRDFVAFIGAQGSHAGACPDAPAGALAAPGGPALPSWVDVRMGELLASWPGQAVFPGGFLRRVGTAEAGIPVFWCMQSEDEARQFGLTVGARRPAFAMRSGVGFLDYGSPTATAFAARYAEEITATYPDGPLVIGGNCQGSIIALDVARRLLAEGREIRLFAVAETSFAELFDAQPFPVPTSLYVANRSKFNPYRKYRFPEAGLRKLFPMGQRMCVVSSAYSFIMIDEALRDLAQDLEEAIVWAEHRPEPPVGQSAGGYPASISHGAIVGPYPELRMRSAQRLHLDVTVENMSPLAWPAFEESGIALGNHWLAPDGEVIIWSDGRAPLTQLVPSGGRCEVGLDITAPQEPGRYLLELDLVEEGVRWFGEKYMRMQHIPVVVDAGFAVRAAATLRHAFQLRLFRRR